MIILAPLEKDLNSLEVALKQPEDEFVRDASIQRFEYSYEFCWKILKRYLKDVLGIEEHNIKNIYREAAKVGLLNNSDIWFRFHEARNLISHTYNPRIRN